MKRSVPVAQNGSVDLTKAIKYKNLPKIYLIRGIIHSNYSHQKVYDLGTFSN